MFQILQAELSRELRYQQSYRMQYLVGVLLYTVGFLMLTGLFQVLAGGRFREEGYVMALVGFLTWNVADRCIVRTNRILAEDAEWGTLEQVWLSAPRPLWIQFNRVVSVLAIQLPTALMIGGIITLLLQLSLSFPPGLLVIFLMTMLGVFGVAFVFAGLHLAYKNVEFLAFAFSSALLFVSGAWAPLDNAPIVYAISRFLPLASGITLMQDMVSNDTSLLDVMRASDWRYLLLNTSVYLVLGVIVLQWGQRAARKNGSLAHY